MSDRCTTKHWGLTNALEPFKSNQSCREPGAPVKPVWLSKHSSNVFPAEFKEDEILRRTTLLFLLRSKSPLRPSGVNKGRCSKWYANWKKKKKSSTNQLAGLAFPTLHILKENFSIQGEIQSEIERCLCADSGAPTAQSPSDGSGAETPGFGWDLYLDLSETIELMLKNGGRSRRSRYSYLRPQRRVSSIETLKKKKKQAGGEEVSSSGAKRNVKTGRRRSGCVRSSGGGRGLGPGLYHRGTACD